MLSFLAAPFALLPSGLTTSIQERLLGFVLGQTLGRLFDGAAVEARGLETDIAKGRLVELSNLRFNADWVDALLKHSPCQFDVKEAGLSQLSIRVGTPVSWNSVVSVEVIGLRVELDLLDNGEENLQDSSSEEAEEIDPVRNLASSLLVDPIYEEILEESTGMPGSFDKPGTSPQPGLARSMLTAFVARLLSRLSFKLVATSFRINFPEKETTQGSDSGDGSTTILRSAIELKLETLHVKPNIQITENRIGQSRQIELGEITLLVHHSEQTSTSSTSGSSPSTPILNKQRTDQYSPTSSEETYDDNDGNMAMSTAIADLRESTVEESVYLSAEEEDSDGMEYTPNDKPEQAKSIDDAEILSSSPAAEVIEKSHAIFVIGSSSNTIDLSLGDDLALKGVTTNLGSIALFLVPWTTELLFSIYPRLLDFTKSPPDSSVTESKSSPSIVHNLNISRTTLILAYEDAEDKEIAKFIQNPATYDLSTSHFRLYLGDVEFKLNGPVIDSVCGVLSVTETCSQLGTTFPVLLFDNQLPFLYGHDQPFDWSRGFPSTPASDWHTTDFRPVKSQQKGRHDIPSTAKLPSMVFNRDANENYTVKLSPLQIFVDTEVLQRTRSFSTFLDGIWPRPKNSRKANSGLGSSPSNQTIAVDIKTLRLQLRCPQVSHDSETDTFSSVLRSGILILDFRSPHCLVRQSTTRREKQLDASLSTKQALVFLLPVESITAQSFLRIDGQASAPAIDCTYLKITDTSGVDTPPKAGIVIKDVFGYLTKPMVDALQLLADDLSQISAHVDSGREDLLGSRFFGFKSIYFSSRNRRERSQEGSELSSSIPDASKGQKLQLIATVNHCRIKLELPSQSQRRTLPSVLDLATSCLDIRVLQAANSLSLSLICPTVQLWHHLANGTQYRLLDELQSVHDNMTRPNATDPMLSVRLVSATTLETGKETRLSLILQHSTMFFRAGASLGPSLSKFVKPPKGAFETAQAAEKTRIKVVLHNVTSHFTPQNLPSRVTLAVTNAKFDISMSPLVVVDEGRGSVQDVSVSLIDRGSSLEIDSQMKLSPECLTQQGFVEILRLTHCGVKIKLRNGSILPDFEAFFEQPQLRLSVCADSLATLTAFLGDLQPKNDPSLDSAVQQPEETPIPSPAAAMSQSVLAGPKTSDSTATSIADDLAEMIIDDVPFNEAYLSSANRHRPGPDSSNFSRLPSALPDSSVKVARVTMSDAGFQITPKYLTVERFQNRQQSGKQTPATLFAVSGGDILIDLYDGFQWQHTRDALTKKIMTSRRRIKELRKALLASVKRSPDTDRNIDADHKEAYNDLPLGTVDLRSEEAIAVIDKVIARDAVEAGWEEMDAPLADAAPRKTFNTKSRKPALTVVLEGATAQVSIFPVQSKTQFLVTGCAETLQILDTIETSTWRKFLTEMRPHDGGVARPRGVPMARFEYSICPPSTESKRDEHSLKVKVSPLRLHVDQDAIDFLKGFAAFKPADAPTTQPSTTDNEAFISLLKSIKSSPLITLERMEILPVKIKLDYKPKRVDYQGLRNGKAIEMMNFFHFEGSEMTLRHITLSGVNGWSRLSDMLQDIWTPDVKTNQLADVISGITPIRSVVNIGSGVADLVLLPIEQYKRDKRLARGLHKGATSFGKATALEAVKLGAKLASGTQVILEQAQSMFGAQMNDDISATAIDVTDGQRSRYATQPSNINDGLREAMQTLQSTARTTTQTIFAVPVEVYEQAGPGGSVKAVLRAMPIAILSPAIGVTQAIGKTLHGVSNQLDPHSIARNSDKYK